MTNSAKILAFSGSNRRESLNSKLLQHAVDGAREQGATVTLISLRDFPMPIFNEDDEAATGLPDSVKRLKALFIEHDALLLACPEYNGSITPLMKNTLDWVSRQDGETSGMVPYRNKTVGFVSASIGRFGGAFGLRHVRDVLGKLGCTLLGAQYSWAAMGDAVGDNGTPTEKVAKSAAKVGAALASAISK